MGKLCVVVQAALEIKVIWYKTLMSFPLLLMKLWLFRLVVPEMALVVVILAGVLRDHEKVPEGWKEGVKLKDSCEHSAVGKFTALVS